MRARLPLLAALVVSLLAPVPAAAAVTHRTVFASAGSGDGNLYRVTLGGSNAVLAKTLVQSGGRAAAHDFAGGRMVFVKPESAPGRHDQAIWLRESTGRSRFLTAGTRAVFTPGRTAILFTRRVHGPDPDDVFDVHDEYFLYRLATGHIRRLFTQPGHDSASAFRYALDGTSIWLYAYQNGQDSIGLQEYRIASHRIVRTIVRGEIGFRDFEMLPSGTRAVLVADRQLWTVHLGRGVVTARKTLPTGQDVQHVHGRLDDRTLLVSGTTGTRSWLGALDLRTFTIRKLSGSTGLRVGVAAY